MNMINLNNNNKNNKKKKGKVRNYFRLSYYEGGNILFEIKEIKAIKQQQQINVCYEFNIIVIYVYSIYLNNFVCLFEHLQLNYYTTT